MADFADVDSLVASYHQRGGQPGLAYGVVIDGELVHAAGLGERALGRPAPDAATVFRIASMTKSFTASAVLALRDDGALRLDDPAGTYVPELADWPPVSPDAAPISIRHLLTMTAGFPTDDPWGDRQQGLPLDDFAAFLARGVRFNWAPGTRFEYSNLGFAILGRVITAVTGAAYPDYIRDRLLRPLGMTRTGFEAAEFDQVARGYRRAPGGWSEVPFEACGAFAPMGGIFSCVQDLSRWVAGFAAAFPPGGSQDGGSQDGGSHPVRRATRREMQLSQVATGWDGAPAFPGYEAAGPPGAYGFGLFVTEHPVFGRIVSHSGGYPGFGSNMCWHLASRTGVVALGNSTYAPMSPLTVRLLGTVLRRAKPPSHGYGVALSQEESGPWPETLAARDTVDQLLRSWDDATAERLFSPNVAADAPFAERQRLIALVRERTGDFLSSGRPPEFDTPAHCRWWLAGDRGVVQVQIQLTPERPPRVQSLTLAVPPAAGSPLGDTLDAVLSWLNGTDRDWPAAIPVVSTVDASQLARRLRMAAVWAGPCRVAAYRAGDGSASVAVELDGQHGGLVLALVIDPGTRLLQLADVAPEPRP
ncbi:MAG: serine hydrolase domain-containing protein [Streptosporangiaceae bacterium]|jgi:CubicO group peptidase (beta-lactamase class C family)